MKIQIFKPKIAVIVNKTYFSYILSAPLSAPDTKG